MDSKIKLLEHNVPVIQFSSLQENTLSVLKTILNHFEAKGRRKYIRVKTFGKGEVIFNIRAADKLIKGAIIDLSAYAFSCKIEKGDNKYFNIGSFLNDIFLILGGVRVIVSAKVLGFSKNNPEIFIFQILGMEFKNNKITYTRNINYDIKNKLYNYIRMCLKKDIKARLDELDA
ncbi:hypothetical protein ES705_49429 [subsurface metagenome]